MTPANITALQALVHADPALAQQLQSATTNEAATQLLAKAASQKGLAVDLQAIADYLKTSPTGRMTDAELEAVAGGADSVPFQGPQGSQGNEGSRGVNGNPYWPSDPEYKSQTP